MRGVSVWGRVWRKCEKRVWIPGSADVEAAVLCTTRLLRIARKHGKRIHVLHVSTADEMPLLAANKDDFRGDDPRVLMGLSREPGRGDEDPLVRTLALQCAGELLDFRTPDGPLPSLGLHVDHVETQPVLFDDSVDAAIAASAYRPACVLA